MARLAGDLGPEEGVVIFPEGTRFTPEKSARVPAAEIPAEHPARIRWLFEHWTRIDAWVGAELESGAATPAS